jgi:hypothetical protein
LYIYNTQNFGFCDSFDEPRWYGTHQKMQKSYLFWKKKQNITRLSFFQNDHGFGFLLASPSQNRSKKFPWISGSTLTNIELTGPPLIPNTHIWVSWGKGVKVTISKWPTAK